MGSMLFRTFCSGKERTFVLGLIFLAVLAVSSGCSRSGEMKHHPVDIAVQGGVTNMAFGYVQQPNRVPVGAFAQPTNDFSSLPENDFFTAAADTLSTFSIDVDTASYAIVRRFLEQGELPPKGTVRIEEIINYFPYAYAAPKKGAPCAITAEVANAFWEPSHKLLRIGVKAQEVGWAERKPSNLVFLVDVSGSMFGPERLGLVRQSLHMLVGLLDGRDTVSIVVYAGKSGVALPPTKGSDKQKILEVVDSLEAGGSTHGSEGIKTAYELAVKNYIKGGINRVILCTDGDFNVGLTTKAELLDLVKAQRESGVFLSVFGYGMGNYKDDMLVKLADNGNGMYAYIDTALEAKKLLVEQVGSSMITVAKDVKIQVEFNPEKVASYRLLGYEKRVMDHKDFEDDTKDAGDMGSGHTVTALYEIIPADGKMSQRGRELKYTSQESRKGFSNEWCTIAIRYKEPEGSVGKTIRHIVSDTKHGRDAYGSPDMRMAAAAAAYGMLLSDSKYSGKASFTAIQEILADPAVCNDDYRREFMGLITKAARLYKKGD